MKIQNRFNP